MIHNLDIDTINKIYNTEKKYFKSITNRLIKNIDGRICHHKLVLLNLITKYYNINSYLEIGVHNGASMSYVVHQEKQIMCYGIDLFEQTRGHYIKDDITKNKTYQNILKNNISNSNIILISGNSHDQNTIQNLKNILNNKSIDLLLIDGDHSFSGVKIDFNTYTNFVSGNGLIVLDDYSDRWPGVKNFAKTIDSFKFKTIGTFLNNELILQKL